MLDQAGLAAALRRAGGPASRGAAPAAAAPEALPEAPAAAAQLLMLLLDQPPVEDAARNSLIVAWLWRAARSGVRAPHATLPALLEIARGDADVAGILPRVWGTRGTWLQGHVDAPLGAPGAEPALDRSAMALPERVAELAFLRRFDPPAGLQRLEADWDGLAARERAGLIRELVAGLSSADESFLEAALDDKAKTVRGAAADLLRRLPGSAFATRMGRRLRGALVVERHPGAAPSIELREPEELDDDAARDGLTDAAEILDAIVAAAPLEVWREGTGLPIFQIAAVVPERFLGPLTAAAQAQADRPFAEALYRRAPDDHLLPLLSDDSLTEAIVPLLNPHHPRARTAGATIAHAPRPWPLRLATSVLSTLHGYDDPLRYFRQQVGPLLLEGLPVSALGAARRTADSTFGTASYRRSLLHAIQHLTFVQSIEEAFS